MVAKKNIRFRYSPSPKGDGCCEMVFANKSDANNLGTIKRLFKAFQSVTGNRTQGGALDPCVFGGKFILIRRAGGYSANRKICLSISRALNNAE